MSLNDIPVKSILVSDTRTPVSSTFCLNICALCVPASLSAEAVAVCSDCVAPYLSSILEALTENISAGIHGMQQALQAQMAPALAQSNGGTGEKKMVRDTE